MHFIIDGYNLAFAHSDDLSNSAPRSWQDAKFSPSMHSLPLEQMRDRVISSISALKISAHTRITLVFDSRSKLAIPDWHRIQRLSVVFAPKGLSADAWIIEMLQGQRSLKQGKSRSYRDEAPLHLSNYTVVSNDRELLSFVREEGALTLTVDAFLKKYASCEVTTNCHDAPGHAWKEHKCVSDHYVKVFSKRYSDHYESNA